MENERFQYYAFISYSHLDENWGKWLQKKLENYQLPSVIRKESGGRIPKHIRPVFRDQTDLGVGKLDLSIRQELADSRYLILICSPNSAKSDYVNKEVQFFQEMGRGDRIIPFIVEGSPDAEEDNRQCYPPALRDTDDIILGASLEELKPEEAFIKIVAAILGLKYDQLYMRHQRREKKKKLLIASIIGVLLFAASIGSYLYWDYNRVKAAYYTDYVETLGIPEGLFKLSSSQIQTRFEHYRFEYQRGKLRKVTCVNSAGKPIISMKYESRPMIMALYYKADSEIIDHVDYLDINGKVLVRKKYSGEDLSVVDFTMGDKHDTAMTLSGRIAYTNAFFSGTGTEQKSDIARYLLEYDDQGRIIQVQFMRDNRNTPVKDADGIFGWQIKRDELGREKQIIYTDAQGKVWPTREGIMGKRLYYNETGNFIRFEYFDKEYKTAYNNELGWAIGEYEYDPNGNIINSIVMDTAGKPCIRKDGISSVKAKYNANGFVESQTYYGIDGKVGYNSDGIAGLAVSYDQYGYPVKETFLNAHAAPCKSKNGYATKKLQYDERGNILVEQFFDTEEQPCSNDEGYAEVRCNYDNKGNLISVQYFDTDGKPCIEKTEGIAGYRNDYDDQGRLIRQADLGVDGKPCVNKYWYAQICYKYDERGNIIDTRYQDVDGNPCLSQNGYAGFISKYDSFGNLTGQTTVDINGDPCLNKNWYAEVHWEYDEHGNNHAIRYFGVDGLSCITDLGYAEIQYQYDAKGNLIEESYWGKNGERVLKNNLFSISQLKYDDYGNEIEGSFWDSTGEPTLIYGYAKYMIRYDERGNEIERAFFDTLGNPTMIDDGYAKWTGIYNDKNLMIRESCWGVNNEPVLFDDFAAADYEYDELGRMRKQTNSGIDGSVNKIITWDYDNRGNFTRVQYFGPDGKPCFGSQEFGAGMSYRYNDRDQVIEYTYLGLDQKPFIYHGGFAIIQSEYDQFGNVIQVKSLDNNGELCLSWFGYSIGKLKYNDKGNVTETRYFGVDGEPCISNDGTAGFVSQYDDRGFEISRFYLDINDVFTYYYPTFSGISGYAGYRVEYDELGRCIEQRFYNPEGKLAETKQGYAIIKYVYDHRGKTIEERYFGIDEKPCLNEDAGYASLIKTYNERGKVVLEEYFDPYGIPCTDIHAAILYSYDENGKQVDVKYIDKKGLQTPVVNLVIVGEVFPGSPAEQAGLQNGDVIVELADWWFFSGLSFDDLCDELMKTIANTKEIEKTIKIIRNDEIINYQLPPGSIGIRIVDLETTEAVVQYVKEIYEKSKDTV